jgi:CBS domain-containing protein
MKTSEIMTRKVISLSPGHSISHAARIMLEHGISGLPVVGDDGSLVGILTEGDLMARIEPDDAEDFRLRWLRLTFPEMLAREFVIRHSWRVSDVMTAPVITVEEGTPLGDVAELLRSHRIRRVPVVRDGRAVGIVSRADLLRAVFLRETEVENVPKGDDAIRICLEARIEEADRVLTGRPTVTVDSGVVHLWGSVGSKAERDALRVIVEGVPNIAGYEDHTTLAAA